MNSTYVKKQISQLLLNYSPFVVANILSHKCLCYFFQRLISFSIKCRLLRPKSCFMLLTISLWNHFVLPHQPTDSLQITPKYTHTLFWLWCLASIYSNTLWVARHRPHVFCPASCPLSSFMSSAWPHVLCPASCLLSSLMSSVRLHVLCPASCPLPGLMSSAWPHVFCPASCLLSSLMSSVRPHVLSLAGKAKNLENVWLSVRFCVGPNWANGYYVCDVATGPSGSLRIRDVNPCP